MTDLKHRLTTADPLRYEPPLTSEEIDLMRERILAGASVARPSWVWPLSLAAGLAAAVVAGIGLTWSAPEQALVVPAGSRARALDRPAGGGGRLQLQFATRGGTRVIWTFNADFEMR
jgi:hypothetical protein